MDGTTRCAGFNVTSSRLQFVEIEKISEKLLITNLGQTFITPSINFEENGDSVLATKLQTAFDEITIKNPIKISAVSFTLPPELFITIQLPYDNNLTQADITEEFRWELSKLFPFISAEEYAIKFYELEKGLLPGNFNALVVALNKKYLLLLKNFCIKNNLSPKLVDNASVTANGFLNNYFFIKDSVTVNIYNSNNTVTLFINISSKPVYVKVFRKASDDFNSMIIDALSEEKIKNVVNGSIRHGFFSGDDISAEVLSQFKQSTGLEFVKFNPFQNIELKTDLENLGILPDQYNTFTAATGIAARSY